MKSARSESLNDDSPRAGDILAVDDNAMNLTAIGAALAGLSSRLVTASSGEDALRQLLGRDFVVVILDVVMPGLDGYELARLIRQRPRTRHVPIIFVTAANPSDVDIRRGYALGAVDYLFKPIVPEVLQAKVKFFVELQQRTVQVALQAEKLRALERAEAQRMLAAERRRWEAQALERKVEEQRRINEELEQADRRKNEFLATLAHELRNPLTPIVSGLELLRPRCEGDDAALRTHATMRRQVAHLTRLVDDLIDVARISSGKIALKRSVVDVADAVQQAVDACASFIERREHRLVVERPPVAVRVDADGARLVQVVANLIANAARYTEPGGTVQVRWTENDGELVLSVSDDGQGIEPELLPKIFDMFVQRCSHEGLGIGLTLVHKLVTLHGGSVQAKSDGLGKGTEFVVRLPALPADHASPGPKPREPEASPETHRPLRIGLIEDDADVRELVGELLRSWGHEVVTAVDGLAGSELLLRETLDVALIDLGLPELDGCQVAQRVRNQLGVRCPRLVAMTGYSQPEHVRDVGEAGFDTHLVKPSSADEIRAALVPAVDEG